jgi:hypothetical protein
MIPVVLAELNHIDISPNVYPGENFTITLRNNILPSLLNINVTQPCISLNQMLMTKNQQNLTLKVNSSIPSGSYICSVRISYNTTVSTTSIESTTRRSRTTTRSTTSTTSTMPSTTSTTSTISPTTSIEPLEETTTTSIISLEEKNKYGKYYITGLIFLVALIVVIAYLWWSRRVW